MILRVACALTVAAAASLGAAPASSPHGSAVGTCTTAQLRIGLTRSFVAAGNVGGYIGFRNRGSTTCRLRGWPTLVALSPSGAGTRARQVRSTMWGPHLAHVPAVTLRPGARAGAAFAAGDNPPSGATCRTAYRHLRIAPPGESRSVVRSAWLPALDQYLPACTRINVTMVVRASDLRGA